MIGLEPTTLGTIISELAFHSPQTFCLSFQLLNLQFRGLYFQVTCDAIRPVLIDSGYIQAVRLTL